MGTMGSTIKCKDQGLYHMKCDDDSIITFEMLYSPDTSHTVIFLADIVTKDKDSFGYWWQLSDIKVGHGKLNVLSSTKLTHYTINLEMKKPVVH